MDECVIRRHGEDGGLRLPVAYLIANFTPGANGGESYLTHDEVETLFHEGGHVFHHLLGRQDWAHHHMSNVEWDAVELPSQVMENWAWEKEILQGISAHRDDKRPIPDDLVAKIQKARLFQYAMTAMRQFELGLVDLRLHMEYEPARPVEPTDVLREVRKEVRIAPIYEHDRFLDSFAHIFAGSYAAGYYGYKWSEAIAADTFEAFIESGNVCDPTVGKKLLALLEAGSSRPFMELIRDFRGRDPDPEALMRRGGMG
jgi:oligopeptidase A